MTLPVRYCNSGSITTSWHTSVRRFTVTSCILLWQTMGNPPLGQERVCSTVKVAPHTQYMGKRNHLYLSARASVKSSLCRQNREVRQFEAPLSLANSIALVLVLEWVGFTSSATCAASWHLS